MSLENFIPVLQLSIAPVIVISGVGLILLSMTNRIARVIDRSRELSKILRNDEADSGRHQVRQQLMILERRSQLLRRAIEFACISLLLAASLVIVLFFVVLMDIEAVMIITLIFISCMLSLIAALIFFLVDVHTSLSALKLEVNLGSMDQADLIDQG
ncbi:MAG: DUF2721 domain-containing protein [Zetaproteobacteria bacterium CG_4_9_14_3_um_filter_53_7]|nr:MAG: DUF2721 domain-containing protein [Zetaproteobacteria bacterium CG_4_9_14_3_um_filter_53_7]